jgi:hypothetical protein
MVEMTERKEENLSKQPQIQASPTSEALAAAHNAPMAAALDSVRWVRRGFLRRLKRDTE